MLATLGDDVHLPVVVEQVCGVGETARSKLTVDPKVAVDDEARHPPWVGESERETLSLIRFRREDARAPVFEAASKRLGNRSVEESAPREALSDVGGCRGERGGVP